MPLGYGPKRPCERFVQLRDGSNGNLSYWTRCNNPDTAQLVDGTWQCTAHPVTEDAERIAALSAAQRDAVEAVETVRSVPGHNIGGQMS